MQNKWDKVFKNGPSKIYGRQPLKNLKRYGLPKADFTRSILEYFVPNDPSNHLEDQ